MSLVSVIIPAYNAQATLADTVRSLLAQSLSDWRAVIVDDGSTDSTPMIASDFAWRDQRITLLRQENRGLAGARNRGLDAAEGRYVHFLDADDWLHPLGLEQLVQSAEWSNLGAACGAWTLHQGDGRAMDVTMPAPDAVVERRHLLHGNVLAPHSHVIRRDLLGGARFDPAVPGVEDYQMWLRLASGGVRWAAVEEPVAAYRVRPGSMSKHPRKMLESALRVMRGVHSETDFAAAARSTALFYATCASLGPPVHGPQGPLAMLRTSVGSPPAFSAEELGGAAYWSLVLGFGVAPASFGATADGWLPRLCAWWAALGESRLIEDAVRALALEAVSPEAVASAMLESADRTAPAIVAGALGRNGRVLTRIARRQRLNVLVRDDRLPRAGLELLMDARSTVLVAPTHDQPILAKLPRGIRTIRWCTTRERLARQLLDRLDEAREHAPAALGA